MQKQTQIIEEQANMTIGLDLGDRWAGVLDNNGKVVDEGRVKVTRQALTSRFAGSKPARIALEAGTHSLWVSALLADLGHEVIVANVRELAAIQRRVAVVARRPVNRAAASHRSQRGKKFERGTRETRSRVQQESGV